MEVDVGAYIAELLYEHDVVNLPGLGSFTGRYQSADIDHVQGQIRPPSKELAFNTNLVLDDGVLVRYVQEKHRLSLEQAQRTVEDYVKQVKAALRNKDIVIFPQLGRLYMDYEGHLKFISEGVNFNTDAYGLPSVQFYPIRRLEQQAGQTTGAGAAAPPEQPAADSGPTWWKSTVAWFDRNILYFIGATAIFIIFVIYWFFLSPPRPGDPLAAEPAVPEIPNERFNISPSQTEEPEVVLPGEETADNQDRPNAAPPEEPTVNTEEPTVAPGQKSGIILIGVFGDPENVKRLIEKLYQAGFEPYTEKAGNLTRVGVQFAYDTEAELQQNLREVRRQFDSKARIAKR